MSFALYCLLVLTACAVSSYFFGWTILDRYMRSWMGSPDYKVQPVSLQRDSD